MSKLELEDQDVPECELVGCEDLATHHIKFDDGFQAFECKRHLVANFGPDQLKLDFHEIGPVCEIDGATWRQSAIAGDGCCSIDWGEGLDDLLESKELVSL